jgi:uncharacterized SAM-binding protein YcdF (DUF218 family)
VTCVLGRAVPLSVPLICCAPSITPDPTATAASSFMTVVGGSAVWGVLYWLVIVLSLYVLIRTVQFAHRFRRAQTHTSSHSNPAQVLLVLGGEEEREYAGVELVRRGRGFAKDSVGPAPTFHFTHPPTHAVFNHPPTFLIVSSGHFEANHTVFRVLRQGQEQDVSPSATSGEHPHEPCYIADHQAIDTVTNFSTLVKQFASSASSSSQPSSSSDNDDDTTCAIPPSFLPSTHVYILTAAYHMPRALAVGRVILSAGYGIGITPVCIHDPNSSLEPQKPSNTAASLLACVPSSSPSTAARAESTMRTMRDVIRALCWIYFGVDGVAFSRMVHPRRWRRSVRQQHEDQ